MVASATAPVEVPSVRGLKDAAKDWLVGAGAGLAMRAGKGIFGANFITSLGIAALTGSVVKGPRGDTLAVMMGYHALANAGTSPVAADPQPAGRKSM